MAESNIVTPSRRGRKWLRVLGLAGGAFLLLVVVGYFVVTSSGFFKGVILPRVSKALNAQVTVADASISPFRQVTLKDLKVQTVGQEPLLRVPELRLRYRLMAILGGTMKVDEVALVSPTVVMLRDAKGGSNLDPILKAMETPADAAEPTGKAPGEAARVDIASIRLDNGTVRLVQVRSDGKQDVTEIGGLSVAISDVKNGQTGKAALSANVSTAQAAHAGSEGGMVQARTGVELSFSLSPQLEPGAVQGRVVLDVLKAAGVMAQAAGLNVTLALDVLPTEVRELALRFAREKTPLAQLRMAGPMNLQKQEGSLAVELSGLDKQLLNLAGAPYGLDFGSTRISSTNQVVLAQGGKSLKVTGRWDVQELQVTRTNQSTPVLAVQATYDSSVDLEKSQAVLSAFNLVGTQNGLALLEGGLSSPFSYRWAGGGSGVGDSTLAVKLTGLNLADWKPFVGAFAPAGLLSGNLELRSQGAGDRVAFVLRSQGSNLTLAAGPTPLTEAGLNLEVSGVATNKEIFHLQAFKFDFSQRNQLVLSASGQGSYHLGTEIADFQLAGQAAIPAAIRLAPMDADFSSGRADMNVRLSQKGQVRDLSGSLVVTNLTGRFGSNVFQAYAVASDFQVGMTDAEVALRKAVATLGSSGRAGGRVELTGTYGLSNQVGNLSTRITQLNQEALRPFLDPMMEDMKVLLIQVNGDAAVQYRANAESVVQTTLAITNLVLEDVENQISPAPLEARLKAEVGWLNDVAELKRVEVGLSPSAKATNNLAVLTGRLDLSDTNGVQGKLKASAQTLDITRYYDVYMGDAPAEIPGHTKPGPGAGGGAPAAEEELEPLVMPVKNLVTEITIGKLYLRELEMTNLQSKLLLDGGRVVLDPFAFGLNGAPARAGLSMDMAVPGWKYDLEFSTTQGPVGPLVDSFMPSYRGQVGGKLNLGMRVAAQGITDANIQKSLTGNFDLATTNLNIAIPAVKNPLLKTVVNVVAIIPEVIKNPKNQLGSLAGALLGGGQGQGRSGGFTDELTQAPIDVIDIKAKMVPGRIDLERSLIQSSAFQAAASGKIETRPVLTNSPLTIPLSVSLRRSLAEKINMLPSGTPTNAVYVALPDYVTIRGTMGEPKSDINYAALAGTALQQLGGKIPGVDEKTSNLIQGLGGMLSNRGAAATNAAPAGTNAVPAGTNAPAGSRSPLGGLERILGPVLGTTNAPSTNAPTGATTNAPATNQSPVGSLLDQLLKQRK